MKIEGKNKRKDHSPAAENITSVKLVIAFPPTLPFQPADRIGLPCIHAVKKEDTPHDLTREITPGHLTTLVTAQCPRVASQMNKVRVRTARIFLLFFFLLQIRSFRLFNDLHIGYEVCMLLLTL